MPTSVMPKGVEHTLNGSRSIWDSAMPTSVMPKGVEHTSDAITGSPGGIVCPPL